jgi:hypothetical protein
MSRAAGAVLDGASDKGTTSVERVEKEAAAEAQRGEINRIKEAQALVAAMINEDREELEAFLGSACLGSLTMVKTALDGLAQQLEEEEES